MTPDEIIERLKEKKIVISKSTINRYEREGLIELPLRGGYGRGAGRWSQHSPRAVIEVATAWSMLSGNSFQNEGQRIRFNSDTIRFARKNALCELLDCLEPKSFLYFITPSSIFAEKEFRNAAEKERKEYEECMREETNNYVDYEDSIRELHKQDGVEFPQFFPVGLFNDNSLLISNSFQELAARIYLNEYLTYYLKFYGDK